MNVIQNYDLIAISESALHKSNSDDEIELKGFVPIRRDLPDDTTHGGTLLYCKENLAIRERKDLETFSNMLVCEVTVNKNKIIISVTYRKHHATKNDLETFMDRYKKMCHLVIADKPLCALHLGDLNSRSSERKIPG